MRQNKYKIILPLLLILTSSFLIGGILIFKNLSSTSIPKSMPQDGMAYLFQYDVQWKNEMYGDGPIEETGCGPTSLAMALNYLAGTSMSPLEVAQYAQSKGYYVQGVGTSWNLFVDYPALYNIKAYPLSDWQDLYDHPNPNCVYIFSMGPGDFTSAGHIIAAKDVSEDGYIHVHDPNSKERSRPWKLEDLLSQASAVFCLER